MSVLNLRGADQLNTKYHLIPSIWNHPNLFSTLRLTSLHPGHQNALVLRIDELRTLVKLMTHFKIEHLQCENIDFNVITSPDGNRVRLENCSNLKAIEMIDCRTAVRFIVRAVCDCPLLGSVNTIARYADCPANLDIQMRIMALKLNKNYRLKHFDMCEVKEFIVRCLTSDYSASGAEHVIVYRNFIQKVIQRNAEGYTQCHDAVCQLALIKRQGNSQLFASLNRDVVGIISGLLYESRFAVDWYPLLELTS